MNGSLQTNKLAEHIQMKGNSSVTLSKELSDKKQKQVGNNISVEASANNRLQAIEDSERSVFNFQGFLKNKGIIFWISDIKL